MADLVNIITGTTRAPWDPEKAATVYGGAVILEGRQYRAIQAVKASHGRALLRLLGEPTTQEALTWKSQQAWAEKYLADGDAAAAANLAGLLTQAERDALGDNAAGTMAAIIAQKVTYTDAIISAAGGIRRTAIKAIEIAADAEAIDAAQAQAKSALAAL